VRFGLFGSATARRGAADPAAGFHDYVAYNVEAEALGFASSFLVEHHFTGIGQVSAPLDLLAWVAARTTTLRIGTAVMVLPWHNPVLLAEAAATLDLMSGGRLDLGIGRGYRFTEFQGFAMDIAEADARFEESMALIVKAWTSDERFSHHGRFWQVENVLVEPPPLQKPHPPLWIAAGSAASIRRTAALGANLLLDQFAPAAAIAERIASYREAIEGLGRRFDPESVAVARNVFVTYGADETAAALEHARAAHARMVALSRHPGGAVKSHVLRYAEGGESEVSALYGTPDAIAAGLEALRAAGVRFVLCNTGGSSPEQLRRFARDVMPGFAD
jgi:alkanesulfonate monooxygenase SsuD/methylene tetrahydromethanopterin reductase-like flavin-dependent oxidoreductase (luciferase family)